MSRLPWVLAGLVPFLLLGLLNADWNEGWTRLVLFAGLAAVLACMHPRLAAAPALDAAGERAVVVALQVLAALFLFAGVGTGVEHVVFAARTGDVRLDLGQSTERAARMLLMGENPYGEGTILDIATVESRQSQRMQLGFARVPRGTMSTYWKTLDPRLRDKILARSAPPSPEARREAALLGFKYGPADVLIATPPVALFGAAGMAALNLAAYVLFVGTCWLLFGALGASLLGRWLGMALVLTDPNVIVSCLHQSANDVRVLVPLVVAMWALLRGRAALVGAALAVSLAMKLAPAVLFLPLLAGMRSWRATLVFAAVSAALFGPFLVWDAYGLIHNVVLWTALRAPDSTSWLYGASTGVAVAGRAALAVLALWLAARQAFSATRVPLRDLGLLVMVAIAAGSTSHNNYLTWLPWLIAAALLQAWFCPRSSPWPFPARST